MTDNIPASAGRSSVDRIRTECPINIARRSGANARGRPAGGFWLTPSRGVEIAGGQFRLPRDGKRKKQFLHTFVCLQKYVACLASGKRVLPANRQTYLCARMRRNNLSHETHGCRAAVPFGQSPKRHQKRFCSPAPNGRRCHGRGCFAHRAKLPQKAPCGAFCFRRCRIGWEKVLFSSCRRGAEGSACDRRRRDGNSGASRRMHAAKTPFPAEMPREFRQCC